MQDMVLFGGIVTNKNNNVWSFDPNSLEWKKINSLNIPANARYGHTSVLYQKKLYIFGGKTKVQNYSFIPDLEIFNLEEKTWQSPVLYTKNTLKLRRNHLAELIGNDNLL
jgi:N-acetylneuraminic acid mutarotase